MPGQGIVGYDFNLLEVFMVLFFKTTSLIFFFYFFLPAPMLAHSLSFFLLLSIFGFEQPLLSQADY